MMIPIDSFRYLFRWLRLLVSDGSFVFCFLWVGFEVVSHGFPALRLFLESF